MNLRQLHEYIDEFGVEQRKKGQPCSDWEKVSVILNHLANAVSALMIKDSGPADRDLCGGGQDQWCGGCAHCHVVDTALGCLDEKGHLVCDYRWKSVGPLEWCVSFKGTGCPRPRR